MKKFLLVLSAATFILASTAANGLSAQTSSDTLTCRRRVDRSGTTFEALIARIPASAIKSGQNCFLRVGGTASSDAMISAVEFTAGRKCIASERDLDIPVQAGKPFSQSVAIYVDKKPMPWHKVYVWVQFKPDRDTDSLDILNPAADWGECSIFQKSMPLGEVSCPLESFAVKKGHTITVSVWGTSNTDALLTGVAVSAAGTEGTEILGSVQTQISVVKGQRFELDVQVPVTKKASKKQSVSIELHIIPTADDGGSEYSISDGTVFWRES